MLFANLHPGLSGWLSLLGAALACQTRDNVSTDAALASVTAPSATAPSATAPSATAPSATAPVPTSGGGAAGASAAAGASGGPAATCSAGMASIPGGPFWVGSDPKDHFAEDESPRFKTELAPYCLDLTEVTVSAYRACVERGACTKPPDKQFHCNFRRADRGEHPINCVTWAQARQFCEARGQRLPGEAEWELAARGGQNYWAYPWGNEPPEGRTCWKSAHSCAVKSFPAGAFGLYDISGNVWEWVDDYYGPYPWPPASAASRVYRGGGWSRRFEKWMHTRLRNREAERFSGAHLGFRCASSLPGVKCPFGAAGDGKCLAGVLERPCEAPKAWNGVRCAAAGEPRCREGRVESPGHGCLLPEAATSSDLDLTAEKAGVQRAASPEFDADCQLNFRDRPHSFRYFGGTHRGRSLVSRSAGCKNRDVGVGFDSTCCP